MAESKVNAQGLKEVILDDVVDEFMHVMSIASHENVKEPEKVYPQHTCTSQHITYACELQAGRKKSTLTL